MTLLSVKDKSHKYMSRRKHETCGYEMYNVRTNKWDLFAVDDWLMGQLPRHEVEELKRLDDPMWAQFALLQQTVSFLQKGMKLGISVPTAKRRISFGLSIFRRCVEQMMFKRRKRCFYIEGIGYNV